MTPGELLSRAWSCGFTAVLTPAGPQLRPVAFGVRLPADLLAAFRESRDAVVRHLDAGGPHECWLCGRVVGDGDREVLESVTPHCDRGGAPGYADLDGTRHPAAERCPYKADVA